MAKRKALSKRTRFEIFKRDGFRCGYCGRTPPDVLLEVDHVVAVANGGSNDAANLITACIDCNRGKSAVPLSAIAPSFEQQAKEARERAEQVEEYAKALLETKQSELRVFRMISDAYHASLNPPHEQDGLWSLKPDGPAGVTVRTFLKRLPVPEILDAVDIAARASDRLPHLRVRWTMDGPLDEQRWRYFCGVCWKKIRDRAEAGIA